MKNAIMKAKMSDLSEEERDLRREYMRDRYARKTGRPPMVALNENEKNKLDLDQQWNLLEWRKLGVSNPDWSLL